MENKIRKNIFIGLAVVFGFVFLFIVWKLTSPNPYADLKINNNDHIKGNKQAKVVLIEYSDFQCPACVLYAPIVKQLAEKFKDKIAVVFRHFPLLQHKSAKIAACAAESAGRQGKFWEMNFMLFEKQKEWVDKPNINEIFNTYAKSLNINLEKFKNDLNNQEIKEKIESDLASGERFNLEATPTFFLNSEQIKAPPKYEEFKKLIEKAIAKTK